MLILIDFNIPISPSTGHPDKNKTEEKRKLSNIMNQMVLEDIYETFSTNKKNIPSSQHLMETSPKLSIYSVTKQASTDTRK